MDFWSILGESWREYKSNFGEIFKIIFAFVAIPALFIYFFGVFILGASGAYAAFANVGGDSFASLNMQTESILLNTFPPGVQKILVLFSIIAGLLGLFGYAGMIAASLKKNKFTFRDALKEGKKWILPSIGFIIVGGIFLLGLYILLIIPGIIFSIYWAFSYYVFVNEKKGIIGSLKESFHIVRGRWWRTFGYILLITIVIIAISLLFSIPDILLGIIGLIMMLSGKFSMTFFVIGDYISQICELAGAFITMPLGILFFKNFYLAMKKDKTGKK